MARLSATPHDALSRALVSSPARAGTLLMEYLPEPVAGLLDPETPPKAAEGMGGSPDAVCGRGSDGRLGVVPEGGSASNPRA